MGGISYAGSVAGVDAKDLRGFFEGWPDTPSPETCLEMLDGSDHVVLALDEEGGIVVGFIAAISDGVLCAFVSSLQVLPAYRGRGIGSELVRRMLEKLDDRYVVSLTCDPKLQPFYERFGMRASGGMLLLNRDRRRSRLDV
jgi:GNAT superfamily N-acetyltransferase